MVKLLKRFFAGDKVFAKVRGYPPWPAKINISAWTVNVFSVEKRAEATEVPAVSAIDSDLETGSLVIDEGEKKKPLKRKVLTATSNTPQDTPEVKKKRGRGKAANDTSKQEAALDSQGEESPKEVVSRSGRKIKPKRFADFSSSDETETNTEHSGRGRKAKNEDSNEHQITPVTHKKRAAIEKRNNEGSILDGTVVSSGTSSDTPSRVLLARTFAGEHVGIKLDIDRPKSFESEKARAQWDWSTARNAMKLKAQLESGEILPEQVKDSLDFNVPVPEDEKRLLTKDGAVHRKTYKLRWLRIEAQLLQLDAQIKSNLGLDRANTDKCLQAMDDILALPIDPLMLKKHPHIVETVKRLRRYIGNLGEWKLSEEEGTIFKQKAEQIRQKAEHIYNKYKAMFTIPEGQSFWQSFSDQVVHFKKLTKDMPEEKVFSLMSDPACSGISEDLPADDSGNQLDTDTTIEADLTVEQEAEREQIPEAATELEPKANIETEPIAQAETKAESEPIAERDVEAKVPTRSASPKDEAAKNNITHTHCILKTYVDRLRIHMQQLTITLKLKDRNIYAQKHENESKKK
ncbi:Hepatoma-derived growth factor, partial [Temnothorax longispinosus]